MSAETGVCRVAAERVQLPSLAFGATFHWDGKGAVSRDIGSNADSEPDLPDLPRARLLTHASVQGQGQTVTGGHARPSATAGNLCLKLSSPPPAIDWEREAQSLTFYLDPGLLLASARNVIPRATGELLWVHRREHDQSIFLYVHPVLLVHAATGSLQVDRVEMVPDLCADDPLLHHITLVLKAAIRAESVAGRLYADSLTNALAVHLLSRYETCRPPAGMHTSSLPKAKLRRTTEYIEAHLAHELSLTELAAVAQTSPDHFGRLFRQATGWTPHQYVIRCRIECAKRLLTETELPIIEVGHQAGFTDQSYFTAVFRKYVATTPNAYRGETQQ
jgi:AraC-like DNA-binding protein